MAELDAWPDIRTALRDTLAAHPPATRVLVRGAGTQWRQTMGWITRRRDLLDLDTRRAPAWHGGGVQGRDGHWTRGACGGSGSAWCSRLCSAQPKFSSRRVRLTGEGSSLTQVGFDCRGHHSLLLQKPELGI